MKEDERSEKCREIFSLLSQYLDLELPAGICREIETHIADCEPCIEFTESLRRTIELCRKYEPSEMPAPLGTEARRQLLDAYHRMQEGRS